MGGSRMESAPGGDVFLVVEAFRWSDGSRLWEHRVKAEGEFPQLHEKHNLATPAPVADGERVYAWFGNGQLVALGMDGKAVWTRHLGREYSPFQTPWGHGSSPTLYRDLLILLCDHARESYLVALDRRTGKERWKADRGRGRASHSTPLVVPAPGGDELIVNSSERIDAYDPATGKLLWHAGGTRQTPIPSAVFHDGVIYLSRGYRNSDYLAIRPGGRGDVTATHIKWRAPGGASYVPSVVQYQGLLYLTNEIGVVTCAEAETGETFVLRARRKPEVLARNDLGERFIASPAISSGRLFLRSDGKLFAVGK
jgi:outer membrane protein assembly factor BamB